MEKVQLQIHDVRSWLTGDGEKRVSVEVSFVVEDSKTRIANVLPVEVRFDEDGDVVNACQYFSIFSDNKKTGKRNFRTAPVEFLYERDAIRITLEAYVKRELEVNVESINLLSELELFNRRNAIEYALKHGDKQMFDVLTGAAR